MPSEFTREQCIDRLRKWDDELGDGAVRTWAGAAADLLARDGRLLAAMEEPPEELIRYIRAKRHVGERTIYLIVRGVSAWARSQP